MLEEIDKNNLIISKNKDNNYNYLTLVCTAQTKQKIIRALIPPSFGGEAAVLY
jgi:plasmid rolling circle replication initiator protein Rep